MSDFSPLAWMTGIYNQISNRTFETIAVPGSHDSAMSELHGDSGIVKAMGRATQTQSLNILQQITEAGVRYLDLRPIKYVADAGKSSGIATGFYSAHYSTIEGKVWVGLVGQSMPDITANIASALKAIGPAEVLFIELSHAGNLAEGGAYSSMSASDQNAVVSQIISCVGGCLYTNGNADVSIFQLTPQELLGATPSGPKVVLWVSDASLADSGLGTADGFFSSANVPYINSWEKANTDKEADFLASMDSQIKSFTPNAAGPGFFLAWHLTFVVSNPFGDLKNFAATLNPALAGRLQLWQSNGVISRSKVPSFIAWDFVSSNDFGPIEACLNLNITP